MISTQQKENTIYSHEKRSILATKERFDAMFQPCLKWMWDLQKHSLSQKTTAEGAMDS